MKSLFGLIILALMPATLAAQMDSAAISLPDLGDSGSWQAYAGGGMAIPLDPGNYRAAFKPGYSWMAGAGYSLPPGDMGYVELTAWFLYGNTPFDEGGFAPDYGLAGNTTAVSSPGDLFLGQVGFRGVFASSNTAPAPYFTLGMGFYHVSVPEIYVSGAQNFTVPEYAESAFGWSAGLGVDIPLSEKLVLFADGKFILGVTGEGGTKQGSVLAGVRVDI